MMLGATLIFFSFVAVQVTSHEIKVECQRFHGSPCSSNTIPTMPADLKVELVTVEEQRMLNISWAINIDSSNKYLAATRIVTNAAGSYHCKYNPLLTEVDINGSTEIWFHHLVKASNGYSLIQVANLPLLMTAIDPSYKRVTLFIPKITTPVRTTTMTPALAVEITTLRLRTADNVNFTSIAVAIFGGLAGLMILSSCYIIYKSYGKSITTRLGFKSLPTDSVPILMVYPAEDSAFQRAVVALAEFLQWHGGCSVTVDMWQQRKIAELGPMRWLAEKANTAHRVLIVCPQSSSQVSYSPPNHTFPEPSIPAAAHDLYPLILNMVASHAKSASDLAKFWVLQLGEQQNKKPSNLPPELSACKSFCLMKDLNKLCRSLHTQSQDDKKIFDLIFRPGVACSEDSTVKLREAVEKLGECKPGIFRETVPLKSVVVV